MTKTGIGTFTTVVFGAGVAFATTLFVSNTVGDEGTGVFFQVLAYFAIASTACTFGADTGLVKTITAQVTLGHRRAVWKTFVIALLPVGTASLMVAVALWLAAPRLAAVFHDPNALVLIQLLSLFIVPGSLLSALFGGMRGFGRVGTFTMLQNVLLPCLRFTAVAAVVLLGLGTVALAAAWVVPVALVLVVTASLLHRTYRGYLEYRGPGSVPDPTALQSQAPAQTPFQDALQAHAAASGKATAPGASTDQAVARGRAGGRAQASGHGQAQVSAAQNSVPTARASAAAVREGTTVSVTGSGPAPAPSTKDQLKSFWSFSAGRGASSLVEIVLEWIDVILVGVFLGPAAAGVYGVVNRCVRLGQMADHSARIVVGPMLGAAMAASDVVRAQTIYLMSTRLLVLVAWPFYLVLLIGGPTLLSFFGPEFEAGYPALFIISIAMALAVTAGGVQSVLLMAGRSRWQLYNKMAALTVAVTGNVLLIPVLGLRGAALTWAAAVLLDCALATWEVHHYLHIRVSLRSISLPVLLAVAVYGVGLGLSQVVFSRSWLSLVASLAALTLAYAALLWRLRVRLGLAGLRAAGAGTRAESGT